MVIKHLAAQICRVTPFKRNGREWGNGHSRCRSSSMCPMMAKTADGDDCELGTLLQTGSPLPSRFWLAAHSDGGNGTAQLPMLAHVAVGTKGHKVIDGVIAQLARLDLVVDLQVPKRPTLLTSPFVPMRHPLQKVGSTANRKPPNSKVPRVHADETCTSRPDFAHILGGIQPHHLSTLKGSPRLDPCPRDCPQNIPDP